MSAADAFFDTNVLLYLLSDDWAKAGRAEDLAGAGGTISVQVLNEFANVARRKFAAPWPVVRKNLEVFRAVFEVAPVTVEVHELGLALAERHQLGLYDALLLAAARIAGCGIFYSEDLQDGLCIENSLTVRNPFVG